MASQSKNAPLTALGEMPVDEFLRDYWQQKPLLIRNALPNLPVIDADSLAGFALEDGIESRLLQETPADDGNRLNSQWTLKHGPLQEEDFAQLPPSHWTLLVQAVDHLLPEIQQLLNRFRFIPNWRVDDVMVSYAPNQGNVGPHFDYYDVFLLQAKGSRTWKIGQHCTAQSLLRADTDCKILTDFNTQECWVTQPGDLLYIPPNIAHWGIANDDCMTYSIGFRAPSQADLLLDFSQEVAAEIAADQRYSDPGIKPRNNPGQIQLEELAQVKAMILQALDDDSRIAEWFGRYITQAKRESLIYEDPVAPMTLSPAARLAYIATTKDEAKLFVNGQMYICDLHFAEALCAQTTPNIRSLQSQRERDLVELLLDNGTLLS